MLKVNYFGVSAVTVVAAALAAGVLALVGTKPAEAAFPGANGKIAFSSARTTGTGVNNPTGDREIFTMNPDGTEQKRRTKNAAEEFKPAFSPNGKEIAFTSDRDGDYEIFVMNKNGKKQKNRTNNTTIEDFGPDWQPLPQ